MTLLAASTKQRTITRFLAASAAGNLVWEVAHVPLYTLWTSGSRTEIAYAVLHCTAGDVLIATVCLLLALVLVKGGSWPSTGYRTVAAVTILLAVAYTLFSEWLNTEVLRSWAYREMMPRLPWLGIGLTPVLQWIVVPALGFWWAARNKAGG